MSQQKDSFDKTRAPSHYDEVARGERFEFGKNWRRYLTILNEQRIAAAQQSLRVLLDVDSLNGQTFLDVGSGSGLFSLAARQLGASVHSFDYDPESVACTANLREQFFPSDVEWKVEEGSVLDREYMQSIGQFNVVYAWGVLHQTGDMWQAMQHIAETAQDGGKMVLAIYNDQGGASRRWRWIKQIYNHVPRPLQWILVASVGCVWELRGALVRLLRLQNPLPINVWREKSRIRGMSVWHDLVDWVGGYPFEVAKPKEVFDFFFGREFILHRLSTVGGGHGCNEYVFRKSSGHTTLNRHD